MAMAAMAMAAMVHSEINVLVGGLEHLDYFPIQLGIIIPTDEFIFFRGVGQPPTSVK